MATPNVDPGEIARFGALARRWWDPEGPQRPLHDLNPARLRHVPDPGSVLRACASLLKPGGTLFVSTLDRTPQAFGAAILGAEYLARLLPRGTHDYQQFIRPSELAAWLREAGLSLVDVSGLAYDPIRRKAWVGRHRGVNYLACATRP